MFQQGFQAFIEKQNAASGRNFAATIPAELAAQFPKFLDTVERAAPAVLSEEARKLKKWSADTRSELLAAYWTRTDSTTAVAPQQEFFPRAFLQPYAEAIRERLGKQHAEWTPRRCPFCLRRPASGVLRPRGDGGQRFLVCSFCLGEWEFRRIVCPACGEENELMLPVYRAQEFNHIRVECCDSCRCYIKTVDLTIDGLADPAVDELASIPLDLWAQQKGYSKLQTNLMLL